MIERDDASEYDGVCGWKMAIIVLAGLIDWVTPQTPTPHTPHPPTQVLAGLMYLGCIVAWVLMYVYFGLPECPAQQTLISLTLLGSLALTAISCSKIAPHGARPPALPPRASPRSLPAAPSLEQVAQA